MSDNRTAELEQSKYKPPYDARPMRMLRHHIECDCLASRRGVLREIEDLFAIELTKRDERMKALEELVQDWQVLYEDPDYGDCCRLRKKMRELGIEVVDA